MNKFIEVEVVLELINNDVQDSVGVCWASSCEFSSTVNTQGMSCSEDPDALQEMYGIYYEGLYGKKYILRDEYEQVWPADD